ncbi:MotA/TolQ/ExbB proton channel family protein [candidate division WOR-3 bacterium]|nr:MotA/TolQ/ExbB proton channel family protein [candidate division WOR-3 bacterium]
MIEFLQKGGPVMYPLMLCSIISLAIIIERLIFWFGLRIKRNRRVLNVILRLAEKGKLNNAIKTCKQTNDIIVKILLEGIKNYNYNFVNALEATATNEINSMKKYMVILDTIITLAPLLGIFGTVTGIIISFGILGRGGLVDPSAVTGGIAQALITTASGLIIAIFTLIPFNYFNSLTESNAQEIEKYVNALEITQWKYKKENESKS